MIFLKKQDDITKNHRNQGGTKNSSNRQKKDIYKLLLNIQIKSSLKFKVQTHK